MDITLFDIALFVEKLAEKNTRIRIVSDCALSILLYGQCISNETTGFEKAKTFCRKSFG